MGARVTGAGTRVIEVEGKPELHGAVNTRKFRKDSGQENRTY